MCNMILACFFRRYLGSGGGFSVYSKLTQKGKNNKVPKVVSPPLVSFHFISFHRSIDQSILSRSSFVFFILNHFDPISIRVQHKCHVLYQIEKEKKLARGK